MDITRQNWFDVRGDETLALDWPLTPMSHVWEIGGFEGRWVGQIAHKFNCYVGVFEPQKWAVERMIDKFGGNDKIAIHPYGLWIDNGFLRMSSFFTDGANVFGKQDSDARVELGEFRLYSDILEVFPHPIDVALMNVEGAEYFLLPAMIKTGWIEKFDHFWCQFHPSMELVKGQSESIMDGMLDTHDLLWDCFPMAVAWRRK